MINTEFIEETSRLENYYEKEYTTEQRRIMYEELKNIQIEKYRADIRQLLRTNKFLPKLADILAIDKETHIETKQENKITKCNKCKGTGYLLYTKIIKDGDKELKYQYAAICDCGNSKQYIGKENYIPYASELGI